MDVCAALHNLAEWGIIVHALFSDFSDDTKKPREASKAFTAWWWSQLWILLVANWVIFAPSLMEAGIGEQARLWLFCSSFSSRRLCSFVSTAG